MAALQKVENVLYEVQEACKQLSLPVPAGVYDSQDQTAILMGSVVNLAGIMVAEAYQWEFLQEELVIVGDGVETQFDLPANFSAFVDNTGWSLAIRRPVVVLNAQQWAAISSWLSQSFYINPACRIYKDKLQFMSAPPVGEIHFQYRTIDWVIDSTVVGGYKQKCNQNSDIPRFDWLLMTLATKLKWLQVKNMNTLSAQQDFDDRLLQLTQRNQQAPVLTLAGPIPGGFRYLDNFFNTPDMNIGI